MTGIFLVGLLVMMAVLVVGGLLDRLLDFDDLPMSHEGDGWGPEAPLPGRN